MEEAVADKTPLEMALQMQVKSSSKKNAGGIPIIAWQLLKNGDELYAVIGGNMRDKIWLYEDADDARTAALQTVASSVDHHDPTKIFVAHVIKLTYLDAAASTYRRSTDLLSRHSTKGIEDNTDDDAS
jgi:hypothetical protein